MCSIELKKPQGLELVDYHHPLLGQVIKPVHFPLSAQDKQLIEDMKYSIHPERLKAASAGMAANQWGINKRIFLFWPKSEGEFEVIINPSYEPLSEGTHNCPQQDLMWEGCFSVPLALGNTQRYLHIRVKYQNEKGETIIRELEGWPARVWQHENDHLNGLLYDNRKAGKCVDKRTFSSEEALIKFYRGKKDCPCGTGKYYQACCGVYHTKTAYPDTPEALMRSRYTAYVKKDLDYIQETMKGPALLQFKKQDAIDNPVEWLGLELISSSYDSNPEFGYVEFIAKYKRNGIEQSMRELSKFHREKGRWYYIDGEHL